MIFLTFILFYTFALWLVDANVEFAIMSTSGVNYSIISTYFYD
ncbi:hypothetical protein GCM10007380_09650 [Gottfriedia solisilvae]|uniref:Uncharacterized protein n=1 Tax=Gottfriedia solisilvae TaxID=1516104 RepID=A0A8J3EXA2_9BACI|nr:hypothetical protein GCM10007380_09650 [Gottfriedia solisilvae]